MSHVLPVCFTWLFLLLATIVPLESNAAETGIGLLDRRGDAATGVKKGDFVMGGGTCGSNIAVSLSDAVGLQVNTGTAQTPVDVKHDGATQRCRYIDNTSSKSHFVPFKTATEWNAFITAAATNPPQGISLTTCARPFSGQDSSRALRFGPSSAKPGMGDTGTTTASVSLPYWRTGGTWPPQNTSCAGATHTFSHSCYEEYSSSHCWKWVPRTCTGSSCSGKGKARTCRSYTYDCTYCGDQGSVCNKRWTNWTETFDFFAIALNSDYYNPSWGNGKSKRIAGSARPDSQCTTRCTFDGHDCRNCAGTPSCLPDGSISCIDEILYDSCGTVKGTCDKECKPDGTTTCTDGVEYDSCGDSIGTCSEKPECGPAAGGTYESLTRDSADLCVVGNHVSQFIPNSSETNYAWTCGVNGLSTWCSAKGTEKETTECGWVDGRTNMSVVDETAPGLCEDGAEVTSFALAGNTYSWKCTAPGKLTETCSAEKQVSTPPTSTVSVCKCDGGSYLDGSDTVNYYSLDLEYQETKTVNCGLPKDYGGQNNVYFCSNLKGVVAWDPPHQYHYPKGTTFSGSITVRCLGSNHLSTVSRTCTASKDPVR